ncbi:unnamed protein product [Trichobilharzia regenti]|uniref:Transmembrane protein n=1 Tax=Trichobilharzia regenti TaxID=157069 RepID=A0A183W2P8_TRIRE|nr:unnamed protein product [Trichobilharzia regenti]VDQ02847.1 unnamed protein product [Trichobilharzia regenti]
MEVSATASQDNQVMTEQLRSLPNWKNKKSWEVSLFECKSMRLGVMSCLCPCCVFGSISQDLGYSWFTFCFLYFFTLIVAPLLWINVLLGCCWRKKLRHIYRIKGNIIFDLYAYLFCCPCTLYQAVGQIAIERYRKLKITGGKLHPYASGFFRRIGHRIIKLYKIPKDIEDVPFDSQSFLPIYLRKRNDAQMTQEVQSTQILPRTEKPIVVSQPTISDTHSNNLPVSQSQANSQLHATQHPLQKAVAHSGSNDQIMHV